MALTFRQVRDFLNTAEAGRVSAAAAGFYVTQSAVPRRLREMAASNVRKKMIKNDVGIPADMITALIT